MLIKFDTPITIETARNLYKDCVKFITTTQSYPNINAIEFSCEPQAIFKRRALEPKVNKKAEKIEAKYKYKIELIWNDYFGRIKAALGKTQKAEEIKATNDDKQAVASLIAAMMLELKDAAESPTEEAYTLGKVRGQIISGQEMDDSLDHKDEQEIEDLLGENADYLDNFNGDLDNELNTLLDSPYGSFDELQSKIAQVQAKKKSRALLYAAAVFSAVVVGTVLALKSAKEEFGHFVPKGGIWILHPEEGKGGEVCIGCTENEGKYFTLDEFNNEHGTNQCMNRCRCDLDMRG